MARSDSVTILPLDRYASVMQLSLAHFNQLDGALAPMRQGCDEMWDQDKRDLLAWTMQQAEELIAIELGTQPAPVFVTDELQADALTGVRGDWWHRGELKTNSGLVSAFGTELWTLVQADATVAYTDEDHDPLGREEVATIGGSLYQDLPACANACDVGVFFRVADGAEDAADLRWQIRPIKVDIDGATMRITAESSQFVRPELWKLTELNCLGSDNPNAWKWNWQTANLVSHVDVYCHSVNTQTPLTLQWDGVCTCTSPCSHDTQLGCAYVTDFKRGFFVPRPAQWNGTANIYTTPLWGIPPESVIVNYKAGFPLDRNCRMDANLERAIVKLTNVLLPEPPCNFCDAARVRWENDRKPVDPLTPEAASMPWDLYSQGALDAWRVVKKMALGRGGKMGRQ